LKNAFFSRCSFMMSHHWYVAFRQPNDEPAIYVRNSKTFGTEVEAKRFARERLEEGCDVSAGTINPFRPKKTVGLAQIASWLEASDFGSTDGGAINKT
jgi:hypothetical protein